MKCKITLVLICVALLAAGCQRWDQPAGTDPGSTYPEAYAYVAEQTAHSDAAGLNWSEILNKIPADGYEAYPGLPGAPVGATLYINGEAQTLDVNDPRLVRLMNFYHNMVYNGVYSYTQGSFSPDEYEEMEQRDCRLELTFEPFVQRNSFETTFDKMLVVQDCFVGVRSNAPFGDYPFSSFGRYPLYVENLDWLDLFGFLG